MFRGMSCRPGCRASFPPLDEVYTPFLIGVSDNGYAVNIIGSLGVWWCHLETMAYELYR